MKIRLLSYNIRFGGRGRAEQLAEVIRAAQPDIVLLQEAIDRDVVKKLAGLCDLPHWDARTNTSLGFLSRIPVASYDWHWPQRARHPYLELVFTRPAMRIFGLHLSAWFSKWSERQRHFEIKALLTSIKDHQNGLHFIAGDFNALAPGELLNAGRMPRWIRAMLWLSGRDIARDTIQAMLDQKYLDIWKTLNEGADGYTFPTWDPHVRLDYIFTPERYRDSLQNCTVLTGATESPAASDHYPLLLEFVANDVAATA